MLTVAYTCNQLAISRPNHRFRVPQSFRHIVKGLKSPLASGCRSSGKRMEAIMPRVMGMLGLSSMGSALVPDIIPLLLA